ncbi:IS630 family transposase [Legionella spiritensis]|uniref:IS630 family transposase n=1 Tax=Legionella spiritensis TaxID=452 RepID=UPI001E5AD232|nr:IS630 family transposase [Legionella spiritensis]
MPPESDGEFAAGMEDVLEIYSRSFNPLVPVICMDEQPIQLLNETRTPISATRHHPKRVDYEYERAGTASIFMFTEPLAGTRTVSVRSRRTKIDWAIEMEQLIRTQYASADKIILVCDNLNTHTRGAFYEAFPAEKAREIVRKIEFHHTPKHGSWLNIAECELSAMTSQCINNRRFGSIELLAEETRAWAQKTNQKQKGVNWQFSIDNARHKLKSIYPRIECG